MDKQRSRREALAKRVYCACVTTEETALRVADWIIAEQERREGPLVKAAEVLAKQGANHYGPYHVVVSEDALVALRAALAAYRALDAPPQRTVEQIAADVAEAWGPVRLPQRREYRYQELLDELAAALRRGKE